MIVDPPPARQRQIYLEGALGRKPALPIRFDQLEQAARPRMRSEGYAYVAAGAGLEETMAANRRALDAWRVVPRMMCNVSRRELSIELFGRTLPAPVLLAPVGVMTLAHSRGELEAAHGATRLGLPLIFSSQASFPMEQVAAAMGDCPRWFQLYWGKSDELAASFVSRAEAVGCEALVITLDTFVLGWRPRDLQIGFLPFVLGEGIAQYVSDPVFQRMMDEPSEEPPSQAKLSLGAVKVLIQQARNYPGKFWANLKSGRPRKAVQKFMQVFSRSTLTWENLAFMRERTRLPILLKGILCAEDARKAVDHGVQGIIVSNHGGRQVDGAVGSLAALEEVAEAVGGRVPLLFDSGVRGGADVFKALALGARAVLLGRPYIYGLALAGADGVEEVVRNLLADLELTMALAGCRTPADIGRECLRRI